MDVFEHHGRDRLEGLAFEFVDLLDYGITFKFSAECSLDDYKFKGLVKPLEFIWQHLMFELADRVDFHLVIVDHRIVVDTIERLHHDRDKHIQHSDGL